MNFRNKIKRLETISNSDEIREYIEKIVEDGLKYGRKRVLSHLDEENINQSEFARLCGSSQSKMSRALGDGQTFIFRREVLSKMAYDCFKMSIHEFYFNETATLRLPHPLDTLFLNLGECDNIDWILNEAQLIYEAAKNEGRTLDDVYTKKLMVHRVMDFSETKMDLFRHAAGQDTAKVIKRYLKDTQDYPDQEAVLRQSFMLAVAMDVPIDYLCTPDSLNMLDLSLTIYQTSYKEKHTTPFLNILVKREENQKQRDVLRIFNLLQDDEDKAKILTMVDENRLSSILL